MTSSRSVADEAEDARAGLVQTLDQLRDNLRPERMMEEVVSNARVGANTLADGLYGMARENPFPAILIGAASALIFGLGSRRAAPSSTVLDHEHPASQASARPFLRARRAPEIGRSDAHLLPSVGDSGTGDGPSTRSTLTSTLSDAMTSGRSTMTSFAKQLPRSPAEARSRLNGLLHEQPLILAALGVAVGAAIGAALPATNVEDEWMGDVSSSVKGAARDAAREELDGLRATAGQTVENLKRSAKDHGLSQDNLNDLVREAGEHAKTAIHDVGSSLDTKA